MKKSSLAAMVIVIIVAIIIYMICTKTGAALLIPTIIFAIIACVILSRREWCHKDCVEEKKEEEEEAREEQEQQTINDLIATYGTPDETIVTDVTRGNEIEGVVLVYDKGGRDGKGFFICNGNVIDKASITDITFNNNFGSAFGIPDEFQVVLSTNEEHHPKLYLRAGNDIANANEIIKQIKSHLEL